MGKFLIAGIIQKETIVKIEKLPVRYKKLTNCNETIFSDIGGDAYNEANALEWLGNEVRLLSLIGEEDEYLIDTLGLDSRYVLPVLKRTPAAVVFYDEHRKQQTFLDIKDLSEVSYEPELFEKAMEDVDMVILSNEEFCRPLLKKVKEKGKKLVVNFQDLQPRRLTSDRDFLKVADIVYVSDDQITRDAFDVMKRLAAEFPAECIILGMGKAGVLMYTRADNMIVPYPSVHIKEVKNTVGAGNALLSCFLHYYQKDADYHQALKYALMFAAYKIGYIGTSRGFMTEEEMSHWYDLIWNRYK